MKVINIGDSADIKKKILSHWVFWISIICLTVFILSKLLIYDSGTVFLIGMFGGIFFIVFFIALLYAFFKSVMELIKYMKTATFDLVPCIIFGIQICVIVIMLVFPTLDYYKMHEKALKQLSIYIEKRVKTEGIRSKHFEVKVPSNIKGISDRYIDAEINKTLIKIRVELTGGAFGGHSFLLYRSDGKKPDKKDLLNFPPHHSTYQKKDDKWYLIDMND